MEELIKALKGAGIVRRADPGEYYVLSGGKRSTFYVDVKKAYGDPYVLNLIADGMYLQIDRRVDTVVGSDTGGMPLATVLSSRHGFNLTLVRKEPKTRGTKEQIEGYVPKERNRLAILDDVFTTGNSLMRVINALQPTGAEMVQAGVVVKREEGNVSIPLQYLLTLDDLIR